MFEFHADRKRYFDIQILNTEKYVLPFIEKVFSLKPGMRVLEIGCGEAGVLKAFIDKGCTAVGIELDESRLVNAREWMSDEIAAGKVTFHSKDIYKATEADFGGAFDIIVLKDVIEHIHDQP
ncbi:MAG: class I SAM-dependent methyltransferase, partial [Chitinophagaceae bacterium]|nr:class I SAM-dependent methyltransferase [Chitinophagaceae bacterium]